MCDREPLLGSAITALALIFISPPEVFPRISFVLFRTWLLTLVLVADRAVVHVFAFAALDGARSTNTHEGRLVVNPNQVCRGTALYECQTCIEGIMKKPMK